MEGYRIVFSDLDGTLLGEDHKVSEETKQKIRQLEERGIPFVMVSARMPSAVLPIQASVGIKAPVICYNGALILGEDGALLQHIRIEIDVVKNVLKKIKELYPKLICNLYTERYWLVEDAATKEAAREQSVTGMVPRETCFSDVLNGGEPIYKISCAGTPEQMEHLERELSREFAALSVHRSHEAYLEIVSRDAKKSLALQTLCRVLGIPEKEAAAFGDNFNDIDMLQAAGLGIAMDNAPEEVKKKAGKVTRSNVQDGVLYMLNRLNFAVK